jgi:hypothetical protein
VSERDRGLPGDDHASAALRAMAIAEARRHLAGANLEPDPQRVAEGWTRRFVADSARAEEVLELYRQLGFDAVADPIAPEDLHGSCEQCRVVAQLQFKVVYTRRPQAQTAE